MTPVITAIIGLVSAILSGGLGFLFARRKHKAQAVSVELENAKEVIRCWRELKEEQDVEIEELKERFDKLQDEFDALRKKYREQCDNCIYRLAYKEES